MVLDSAYPIRGDHSNSELVLGISNLRLRARPRLPALNGELDTVTSRLEAQQVQALFQPGAQSQYVQVANAIHETAIYSGGPTHRDAAKCVAPLVAAFIQSGGRLEPSAAQCARAVRPFRPVPQFARHVHELRAVLPTAASADDQVSLDAAGDLFLLQLASVAVEAIGDVFSHYQVISDATGVGLRGGNFTLGDNAEQTGALFELEAIAWTEDSTVSGQVSWDMLSGVVRADVAVQARAALGRPARRGGAAACRVDGHGDSRSGQNLGQARRGGGRPAESGARGRGTGLGVEVDLQRVAP